MFDPNTSIDKLRGVDKNLNESDVVNILGSVNGKTRKIKPSQLSDLIGGGGGPAGDYIPTTSKGKANGVASLNDKGFVPAEQLNIGSASGPFIVKPWDVKNTESVQIEPKPTNNIELTIQQLITEIKYKKVNQDDVHLKNTFFKSSDNIDYINGRVVYSGPVKPTSQNIPYPSIGFNNVGDFSFQFSLDDAKYAGDIAIVITREIELEKALMPTETTPASVVLSINGSSLYADGKLFDIVDKDIISVYRKGNVFNITVGNNNIVVDITKQNLPNPDLVWNVFLALGAQPNPETSEYDKDYSILISNIIDNKLGGCLYHGLPEQFKVKLQPITADDPYNYVFCLSENITSSISDLITGNTTLLFFSAAQNSANIQLQDGTSKNLIYQPDQIFEFDVNTKNNTLIINGVTYTYSTTLNWKTFSSFFFNGGGSIIETRPAEFSYELIDFVVEENIPAEVPQGSKDGDVFKIVNNGIFNGKELKENDYAILFNELTDVIVTRLPSDLDEETIETLLDFKLATIQAENKSYTDAKFESITLNYRGKFQYQNNIYVVNPKEGDYVLVTNGGTDNIPYYYIDGSWKSSRPAGVITNSDAIQEGVVNKFFTDANMAMQLPGWLASWKYIKLDEMWSYINNKQILPGGEFESNLLKKNDPLETLPTEYNNSYYPTVKAVIDYIKKSMNERSSHYVDSKTILTVTSKESKFKSSDDSFIQEENTVVSGKTLGKVLLKSYEGEINDPLFPTIPANDRLNVFDGFILDIMIARDRNYGVLEASLGVNYMGYGNGTGIPDFIGIDLKDNLVTGKFVGRTEVSNGQVVTVAKSFGYDDLVVAIRFLVMNQKLSYYIKYSDGSWSGNILLVDNLYVKQAYSNITLFSDIKSDPDDSIKKVKLTYRPLLKTGGNLFIPT